MNYARQKLVRKLRNLVSTVCFLSVQRPCEGQAFTLHSQYAEVFGTWKEIIVQRYFDGHAVRNKRV
jgi:hypothetical protein